MGVAKTLDKTCSCPCQRAFAKWPVIVLSLLSLIFTIAAIVMCLEFQESRLYNLPGFMYDFSVSLVMWIVVIAILALLAVVLGVASGFIITRHVVIAFGILMLPVWIVFMIKSMELNNFIMGAEETPEGLQVFCDAGLADDDNAFQMNMKQYATDLNILYDASDKWMCSGQCPCKTDATAAYAGLTEAELNAFGRTDAGEPGLIGFRHPELQADQDEDYFPYTFFDCYFQWKADWTAETSATPGVTPGEGGLDDWEPTAQADFENLTQYEYAFDLAEYLELNYACAGICSKRLFYFARSPSSFGDADYDLEKQCSGEIAEQIVIDGSAFGFTLMTSSLVFLLTWAVQYALWCRYKDQDEVTMNKPTGKAAPAPQKEGMTPLEIESQQAN